MGKEHQVLCQVCGATDAMMSVYAQAKKIKSLLECPYCKENAEYRKRMLAAGYTYEEPKYSEATVFKGPFEFHHESNRSS